LIRKHLALAVALVVASGGAAFAASTSSAPVSSQMIRTLKDAAACGKGFTLITVPESRAGYLCTHTAADPRWPAPASFAQPRAAAAVRGPATAKVPCYGDGTTGPRIQMIYGFHGGIPNRAKTVVPQIQKVMAPRMQAVINAQALGRNLGLRFAMTKGCKAIDVKVVEFPEGVQELKGSGQFGAISNYLAAIGMDREDRKYQVIWDGFGGCGIAAAFSGLDPVSSAPVSPVSDGSPTIGGRAAPPRTFSTKYSLVWKTCYEVGRSGVTAQIHELFHNLGAVQNDAPHSDAAGHVFDGPSVMNARVGEAPGFVKACAKVLVETLDCGMDDYWNPSPRPDSYLSTHLNVAKSQFFGPQPQDLLVASPL